MGTQKPGEWANSLIARFEEQVNQTSHVIMNNKILDKPTIALV